MKRLFFILTVIILSTNLYGGITDSLSIGFAGGHNSYNTFRGEIYLKSDLQMFNRKAELKFGMNNRSYQLTFDNVPDLDASSIGFFGDITIYPFNQGFFTGIRWELINFNWLTADSKTTFESKRNYTPTSLYTGTCMFFQLGYRFRISDNFGIILFGQPGVQQFKISSGSSSTGSVFQSSPTVNPLIENHYEFIYNINLGIEIRLK